MMMTVYTLRVLILLGCVLMTLSGCKKYQEESPTNRAVSPSNQGGPSGGKIEPSAPPTVQSKAGNGSGRGTGVPTATHRRALINLPRDTGEHVGEKVWRWVRLKSESHEPSKVKKDLREKAQKIGKVNEGDNSESVRNEVLDDTADFISHLKAVGALDPSQRADMVLRLTNSTSPSRGTFLRGSSNWRQDLRTHAKRLESAVSKNDDVQLTEALIALLDFVISSDRQFRAKELDRLGLVND